MHSKCLTSLLKAKFVQKYSKGRDLKGLFIHAIQEIFRWSRINRIGNLQRERIHRRFSFLMDEQVQR